MFPASSKLRPNQREHRRLLENSQLTRLREIVPPFSNPDKISGAVTRVSNTG